MLLVFHLFSARGKVAIQDALLTVLTVSFPGKLFTLGNGKS